MKSETKQGKKFGCKTKLSQMKPLGSDQKSEQEGGLVEEQSMSSLFQSVSEIGKASLEQEVSKLTSREQEMTDLMRTFKSSDKISDLIKDYSTTLVSDEYVIDSRKREIHDMRFILFQQDHSESHIVIKNLGEEGRKYNDNEGIVFHQCTFFLCDTRETKDSNILLVGIKIGTEEPVSFIDCSFIGMNYTETTVKTTEVDYIVFNDFFSKIDLKLVNCYARGVKSFLYTNFPVASLEVRNCHFEAIDSACMHLMHPNTVIIKNVIFQYCMEQPIHIKIFEEDSGESKNHTMTGGQKRASIFATTTKIDRLNSASLLYGRDNPTLGNNETHSKKINLFKSEFGSKKVIKITKCKFQSCENCIKIRGIKKTTSVLDDLDISLNDNIFESIRSTCIFLENIYPGRLEVITNRLTKCNSIAFKILNCKASKDDILLKNNYLSTVYTMGVCIESSIVTLLNNTMLSCGGGVFIYLTSSSSSPARDEIFDSHKDIILRESQGGSFLGGNNGTLNTHGLGNVSILAGESLQVNPSCRVILQGNTFKELSQYGVMIQSCSCSSLKIEGCRFVNVKEPVLINEREVGMVSRNYTKNFLLENNSELLAPSICNTPRQFNNGKGTIVVKKNLFEGGESSIVKQNLASHLYDIDNSILKTKN